MALITIAEYEDATGINVDPTDEPALQAAIDSLTLYIEGYINWSFTSQVDVVVKVQSDYEGTVQLSPAPVNDVADVVLTRTSLLDEGWDWDDIDTVYGLLPHRAYTVTYSFGTDTPPDDLKAAALQMLIAAGGKLEGDQSGPLTRRRVGDIEEEWEGILGFEQFAKDILDSYRPSEQSYRLGPRQFPAPPLSFQQGGSGS